MIRAGLVAYNRRVFGETDDVPAAFYLLSGEGEFRRRGRTGAPELLHAEAARAAAVGLALERLLAPKQASTPAHPLDLAGFVPDEPAARGAIAAIEDDVGVAVLE